MFINRGGCVCDNLLEIVHLCRGLVNAQSPDCVGTIGHGFHDFVVGRNRGIGDVFMLEAHCVAVAIALGAFDVAFMGAVVLR